MIDWHSLLRRRARAIEDGIYTFAGPNGMPQPWTARRRRAADAHGRWTNLADDGVRGWWERDERLLSLDALVAMRDAGLPEGDHLHGVDPAYA